MIDEEMKPYVATQFTADVSVSPELIVRTHTMNGYSLRSKPAHAHKLLV